MNNFLEFLLSVTFFREFLQSVRGFFSWVVAELQQIKPFSWQTTLLLSLLSWVVYLLLEASIAKGIVSFFGWVFLILGVDWALFGRTITIPLLEFRIRYGPWITGAIVTLALYSNRLLFQDVSSALTSYPLISVVVASLPKFVHPGPRVGYPSPQGRQDIVILLLLGGLYSSWFQLHFALQDLLQQYPTLLADDFSRSSFVVRFDRADPSISKGVDLLAVVESTIRAELNNRSWLEVQQSLRTIQSEVPELATIARYEVFGYPPTQKESQLWRINAQALPSQQQPGSLLLQLQALWYGPSFQGRGYVLQQSCLVQQATIPLPTPANPGQTASYQMSCGDIESSLKNEN